MRSEDEIEDVARRQVMDKGIRIGRTVVASIRSCLFPNFFYLILCPMADA